MCGQGMVPLWLIILIAPVMVPTMAVRAALSGAERAVEKAATKSSSNSIALFSKLNPSSLSQKITNITHKISLASSTKIFGENTQYKLSEYFYKRAVYQLLLRNIADAQKDLQESINHYTSNFRARFLQGSIFFMMGQFNESAVAYQESIPAYDKFTAKIKGIDTLEQATETMNKLENFGIKARDKFNSVFSSAIISKTGALKETVKASSEQSKAHLQVLEVFEEQQKQVTKADVYNALGICYMNASMDDLEHAIEAFNEAISLCPETSAKRAQFAFNMCLCLFYDRQFQQVQQKLNELVIPIVAQHVKMSKTAATNDVDKSFNEVCYKAFKMRGYLGSYFGNSEQSANDYKQAAEISSIPLSRINESFYYRLIPEPIMQHIIGYLPSSSRKTMLLVSRHVCSITQHPAVWPVMQVKLCEQKAIPQDFKRFSQATKLEVYIDDETLGVQFFDLFPKIQTRVDTIHVIGTNKMYDSYYVKSLAKVPNIKFISITRLSDLDRCMRVLVNCPDLLQLDLHLDSSAVDRANAELKILQQQPEFKCQVNIHTI